MLTFRKIKKKLRAVSVIETIAAAYQEISKKEMNEIREMTLKNREFIEEISRVYFEAERSYLYEKEKDKKQVKQGKEKIFPEPKKERLVVFLSANARFYGSLILNVWKEASSYLAKNKADLAVVGEVGKSLAGENNFSENIYYFNIDDEKPKEKEIREIVKLMKNYKEVKVFHGRFKTVLSQEVFGTDIILEAPKIDLKNKEEISVYLLEPSAEAVLDFFKTELISAFFAQTFLEHRLSRHAVRMVKMYQTRDKAKERKEDLKTKEKKLKWQTFDRKQQEINASSQSWK